VITKSGVGHEFKNTARQYYGMQIGWLQNFICINAAR
jgi:hypothetical protein